MKEGKYPPEATAPATTPQPVKFSFSKPVEPTAKQATEEAQQILQNLRQKNEIAEAEAAEAERDHSDTAVVASAAGNAASERSHSNTPGGVRATVDEVAVFFAATDHGKSVTNLTGADFGILDD